MNREELEIKIATDSPDWWRNVENNVDRIDRYTCELNIHHYITTRNRDAGVTPYAIRCAGKGSRARSGRSVCPGFMKSRSYRTDQNAEPGYEWFRPESVEGRFGKTDAQHEHVMNGGLLIRRLIKTVKTPLDAMTDVQRARALEP